LPTTTTHAILAATAAKAFGEQDKTLRLWCVTIALSLLPDADTLGFLLGVPYGDSLGHRGFFHSPSFSLVLGIFCATAFFSHHRPLSRTWWKYVAFFFVVGASHGVLDAFTDGGFGVALLAPFSDARYFSPWRPIPVAPIGFGAAFSGWGGRVIGWEIVHLWVPAFAALAGFLIARRRLRRAHPQRSR